MAIDINPFKGLFIIGNYKETFENEVSKLLETEPEPALKIRIQLSEALCDAYVNETGNIPDGVQLNRLANWLLLKELKDRHPDKVTRAKYPILSKRQLRVRHKREKADEFVEKRAKVGNEKRSRRDLTGFSADNQQ